MNVTRLKGLFRQIFAAQAALTEHQQMSIRASFDKLRPIQGAFAALFCERLLALDPKLSVLLMSEMKAQRRTLTGIIGAVVDNSHNLRNLVAVRDLGWRLNDCGVVDRDYDTVEAALIWTWEQGLRVDFTAETREAWTVCYGILAEEVKFAASKRKVPLLPPC